MNLPRRSRAAAVAAALSAALVGGMTGTALTFGDPDCTDVVHPEDALTDPGATGCESRGPAGPTEVALGAIVDESDSPTPVTTPQSAPPVVPLSRVQRAEAGAPAGPG